MIYYRNNAANCYFVVERSGFIHQYGSLSQLRLDWPFAKRITVH